MIDDLGGVTSKLVATSLDALLLRHQVTSHNIANASTPGYLAQRVSFEDYLANVSLGATDAASQARISEQLEEVKAMIDSQEPLVYATGSEVEIDREMVELTETVLKYRAIIEGNSKRGEIMGMAVRGRSR